MHNHNDTGNKGLAASVGKLGAVMCIVVLALFGQQVDVAAVMLAFSAVAVMGASCTLMTISAHMEGGHKYSSLSNSDGNSNSWNSILLFPSDPTQSTTTTSSSSYGYYSYQQEEVKLQESEGLL